MANNGGHTKYEKLDMRDVIKRREYTKNEIERWRESSERMREARLKHDAELAKSKKYVSAFDPRLNLKKHLVYVIMRRGVVFYYALTKESCIRYLNEFKAGYFGEVKIRKCFIEDNAELESVPDVSLMRPEKLEVW